jgi:hypothetical protein
MELLGAEAGAFHATAERHRATTRLITLAPASPHSLCGIEESPTGLTNSRLPQHPAGARLETLERAP